MSKKENITLESVYVDNVEKLYKFFYLNVLNKQTVEDMTLAFSVGGLRKF